MHKPLNVTDISGSLSTLEEEISCKRKARTGGIAVNAAHFYEALTEIEKKYKNISIGPETTKDITQLSDYRKARLINIQGPEQRGFLEKHTMTLDALVEVLDKLPNEEEDSSNCCCWPF